MLRVLISGGGTGGHIFPAVAIANAVMEQVPDAHILFVGAEGKMEMEKIPAAGYRIEGLPIRGFQRHNMMKNLSLPVRVIKSLLKARSIVRTFKPDVAVGVGGYASGPVLYMASRAGVPTLIQEQNSFPGVTNKVLAKRASKICVAYEGMDKFFPPTKLIVTGNPVRKNVVDIAGKAPAAFVHFDLHNDLPVLFVTGGSLGARSINHGVRNALSKWKEAGIQVIWQTGKPFYQAALDAANEQGANNVHVHAFIKEMDLAYAAADVVLARAGAMSISELCLVKKPAILVPLPTAAEDHQTMNAKQLSEKGAALLLSDSSAPEAIADSVLSLIRSKQQLNEMIGKLSKMGYATADTVIAAEVVKLAKG